MNKKKVLFVIDKPNWAYDQMADYIIKELSSEYEFYKDYQILRPKTWKSKIAYPLFLFNKYRKRKVSSSYDVAIYLWWNSVHLMPDINTKKKLVGIFTEGFPPGFGEKLEGVTPAEFLDIYIRPANGIVAGNKNIEIFYKQYDIPVYYATGATDTSLFNYNRVERSDDKLRVCWTGNPHRNFKGFFDFVEPAVRLAQLKRPGIELITRFSGPLETLPDFYRDADIMVNASVGDAGPGFIVDAGACGVPVITTDGGFASEIIEDRANGLFVERDVEKIAEKIIEVYDDRKLLDYMSKNISNDIVGNWGHTSRAKYWSRMFAEILEGESNETM